MHSHPNAHLTPRGRARVFAAVEAGMTVSAACIAFRVSRRWYYRWLPRWQAQGRTGLIDRSSRPHRSPQRLSVAQEAAIVELRTKDRAGRRLPGCAARPAGVDGAPGDSPPGAAPPKS